MDSYIIRLENGKLNNTVLTITSDGRIELGPAYTPTSAAVDFIKALRSMGLDVKITGTTFTHALEFRMSACDKHYWKGGHRWWCRKCDRVTEDEFRDVVHSLWELQGAGNRIVR